MNRRLEKFLLIVGLIVTGTGAFAGSQNFGEITLTEIVPRVITPNADLKNDKVFFKFDSPLTGIPFACHIYDINGAQIRSMDLDLSDQALSWDGKDTSGAVVPAGIYLYQITIGKKSVSGAVVVAK